MAVLTLADFVIGIADDVFSAVIGDEMMSEHPALTEEERKQWNDNGFLHLKQCLSPDEVSHLTASLGGLAETAQAWSEEQKAAHISMAGRGDHLDIVGLPMVTDAADFVLDHPNIFGRILGLMGPYIYVPAMEYLERHPHDGELLRLHTDGGGSLRSMFPSPDSLVLQLKVQIFLTDVDKPNSGNFMMVPASHRTPFPMNAEDIAAATKQAIPVLAKKGDALIFPWSLWHAVAPNRAATRKSIITRYTQLWMRPVDYERAPDSVVERMTQRRRRLMARMPECQSQGDFYRPKPEIQIDEMFGDEWHTHPQRDFFDKVSRPIRVLFDQ